MSALVGLLAACLIGVGFVAQQHAAYREPLGEIMHVRLLLHLLRKPLWLVGIGTMVLGQAVGAVALDVNDVTLVEPLLATNLIFALLAAHVIYKERLTSSEWWGALLVSGGVALFLVVGEPHGGAPPNQWSPRWLGAALVVGVGLVLALMGRSRSLRLRATLLALAAGLFYGVQDALTRSVLLLFHDDPLTAVLGWQPYGLVLIGATGLLFTQSAFDAAPLRISLPATTAAEPLAGIGLGLGVFAEHLSPDPVTLFGGSLGLAGLVLGIMILGRSPFLAKPADQGAAVLRRADRS
jgi:drug/metabolite transporter (DMT)-like permease